MGVGARRRCRGGGGGLVLVVAAVAVLIVALVLMFARDWEVDGDPNTGTGFMTKLKIVITHLQAPPPPPPGLVPLFPPMASGAAPAAMQTGVSLACGCAGRTAANSPCYRSAIQPGSAGGNFLAAHPCDTSWIFGKGMRDPGRPPHDS